jgi:deoxyribose-phosphate aldolase
MVVNIGRVLSEKWEYVQREIELVNQAVTERGAILKVIFENDCESNILIFLFDLRE